MNFCRNISVLAGRKMNNINNGFFLCMLFFLWCLVSTGMSIDPFSHSHSLITECLRKPPRSSETQGFLLLSRSVEDDSDEGWKIDGNGIIREIAQRVQLHQGNIYSFSAWVKLRKGNDKKVGVVFRTENERLVHGGEIRAKQGCWTLLKGGIVPDVSGPVDIFFESEDREAKISATNVLLKQFSKEEWKLKQDQLIEKIRKSKVRFEVTYQNKTAVKGAVVSLKQTKSSFLLGCGINFRILQSQGYREWFASRFKITSFTNEMKWYATEKARGQENYTLADSMLKFAKDNGILVRGHTVLWDNPKMQPSWVKSIKDPKDVMNVTLNRINSVMKRYKGKLTGWDVVNENVHWDYFEKMLGENASSRFYNLAYKIDPDVRLFVNEYNTIENPKEFTATPIKVKKEMEKILAYPGNKNIKGAIGAQGHFGPTQPNLAYMRSALDTLGSLGLPIWLTELDMPKCPNQEKYIEDILREAYSHPAVEGIIIFGGPEVSGFDKLTLADKYFNNTKTGDVIDKLLKEWHQKSSEIPKIVTADSENEEEDVSLLHGHYSVNVSHPWMKNLSTNFSMEVTKEMGQRQVVRVVINA
ncbi:PREDICTED: uncharacterized protein LOC104729865 [Camelina sativa]|uniref:Uncharacterized protein LOC104729865 n=1 Tax=Camelina sativa TaxID=90675 RepID=A0ABM1QR89_CAMSA|nr:PREDICTED: uncharacterized protein LOC104729865 [Camelina sativa]